MKRLEVDWTACRGSGTCSELLPERVALDPWGFPVLDPTPVPDGLQRLARRTVATCPTRALSLREVHGPLPAASQVPDSQAHQGGPPPRARSTS